MPIEPDGYCWVYAGAASLDPARVWAHRLHNNCPFKCDFTALNNVRTSVAQVLRGVSWAAEGKVPEKDFSKMITVLERPHPFNSVSLDDRFASLEQVRALCISLGRNGIVLLNSIDKKNRYLED